MHAPPIRQCTKLQRVSELTSEAMHQGSFGLDATRRFLTHRYKYLR